MLGQSFKIVKAVWGCVGKLAAKKHERFLASKAQVFGNIIKNTSCKDKKIMEEMLKPISSDESIFSVVIASGLKKV